MKKQFFAWLLVGLAFFMLPVPAWAAPEATQPAANLNKAPPWAMVLICLMVLAIALLALLLFMQLRKQESVEHSVAQVIPPTPLPVALSLQEEPEEERDMNSKSISKTAPSLPPPPEESTSSVKDTSELELTPEEALDSFVLSAFRKTDQQQSLEETAAAYSLSNYENLRNGISSTPLFEPQKYGAYIVVGNRLYPSPSKYPGYFEPSAWARQMLERCFHANQNPVRGVEIINIRGATVKETDNEMLELTNLGFIGFSED
ncbi:MAG: hypothetical protein FWH55_10945 [Oscillospiraceae bacterium]|nr:hypothetical protein [Oscillospiraceae bacterium]